MKESLTIGMVSSVSVVCDNGLLKTPPASPDPGVESNSVKPRLQIHPRSRRDVQDQGRADFLPQRAQREGTLWTARDYSMQIQGMNQVYCRAAQTKLWRTSQLITDSR